MAHILSLKFNGDPILRAMSREVTKDEISDLTMLCADMIDTMEANEGVGLAAPQVGENIRLIVVATKDKAQVMFNPTITKKSFFKEWGEEGCLSIPKVFGDVKRNRSVTCEFIDEKGHKRIVEADGLMARVIQHEIDHIDGILFIDKAKHIHTI